MADIDRGQLNRKQIQKHLKSAVLDLTPNVFERIDLSVPQEKAEKQSFMVMLYQKLQPFGALAAACFCVLLLTGGIFVYQNGRVDSIIGIDVNPSIELSVNKRNRVVDVEALNADAVEIMDQMELKGVDLNIAVNAVIGSMVKHGYLDDLDNAILVTVSNDSVSKAADLRLKVVEDIQISLEENQVKAVVYDQQAVEMDDVKQLAQQYGISYGKAYFLKELIDQNPVLTMDDLKELAPLTMEQIAREITERAFAFGEKTDQTEENIGILAEEIKKETEEFTMPETSASLAESESIVPVTIPPVQTTQAQTTAVAIESSEEETTAAAAEGNIKIDYVDYEKGVVTVNFKTSVKWKNPTVSVKDKEGNTYAAMIDDTSSSSCVILVSGLEGGYQYSFVLGGVSPKVGKPTTVKGTFETPVIGEGATAEDEEESVEPETSHEEVTAPEESGVEQTKEPETGKRPQTPETTNAEKTSGQETVGAKPGESHITNIGILK